MTPLRRLRQKLTFLLGALAVVDIILAVYLLWPGGPNSVTLRAKERDLMEEHRAKTREVAPLLGIDEKLAKLRNDLKGFYQEQLPGRYSQISEEMQKLAKENGISYPQLQYSGKATDLPDVQRITVDTTIAADYSKIPRFINAMERDRHLLMIIDQISVSGQEDKQGTVGQVSLHIKFETYLKTAT